MLSVLATPASGATPHASPPPYPRCTTTTGASSSPPPSCEAKNKKKTFEGYETRVLWPPITNRASGPANHICTSRVPPKRNTVDTYFQALILACLMGCRVRILGSEMYLLALYEDTEHSPAQTKTKHPLASYLLLVLLLPLPQDSLDRFWLKRSSHGQTSSSNNISSSFLRGNRHSQALTKTKHPRPSYLLPPPAFVPLLFIL